MGSRKASQVVDPTRPYATNTTRDTSGEGPRRRVSDEVLAKMLEQAGGFESAVARQIGCSVPAISKRIKKSRMLQETMLGIRTTMVNIAESSLVKAVKEGDVTATIFTLKCLGKDRGWIDRQVLDVEHSSDKPPIVFSLIAQDKVDRAKAEHDAAQDDA